MHDLLSDDFSRPIINWVGDSERINYYIHDSGGFKYDFNTKSNIFTHRYDSSELSFVNDIFDYLDNNIDLDFTRVFDRNLANIEITKADDNAKLLGKSDVMGYAQALTSENRVWMDLWWKNIVPNNSDNKYTEYTVLSELESFTIVHEIGHGLGLSHPRNDPFGKWHNTNDTIMSYNVNQISGNKALNFTDADISTLQLVYGKENDGNSSQNKILNNSETRNKLSQLSHNNGHGHAAKGLNYSEDELIGLYNEDNIYKSNDHDDLLVNDENIETNNFKSINYLSDKLTSYESSILNSSTVAEAIEYDDIESLGEESQIISPKYSDKNPILVSENLINDHNNDYKEIQYNDTFI